MAFPSNPINGQTATVNGISYTYSSATRSWLRNGTLASNIAVTGNITASNYIISGTGIFYSNGTAYSSGSGGTGYPNSSLDSFPGSSGNYDYGSGETYVGESSSYDAFGITTIPTYSMMDPVCSTSTTDLGVLT